MALEKDDFRRSSVIWEFRVTGNWVAARVASRVKMGLSVVIINPKIAFIFISFSAVHIYNFHIFTATRKNIFCYDSKGVCKREHKYHGNATVILSFLEEKKGFFLPPSTKCFTMFNEIDKRMTLSIK